MATKYSENWLAHYEALRTDIDLPDKHRVECRALLGWAKYQRKRIKDGSLNVENTRLINELMTSQSTEHKGGRRSRHLFQNIKVNIANIRS